MATHWRVAVEGPTRVEDSVLVAVATVISTTGKREVKNGSVSSRILNFSAHVFRDLELVYGFCPPDTRLTHELDPQIARQVLAADATRTMRKTARVVDFGDLDGVSLQPQRGIEAFGVPYEVSLRQSKASGVGRESSLSTQTGSRPNSLRPTLCAQLSASRARDMSKS